MELMSVLYHSYTHQDLKLHDVLTKDIAITGQGALLGGRVPSLCSVWHVLYGS